MSAVQNSRRPFVAAALALATLLAGFASALPAAASTTAAGREFHVSPTGSDTAAGTLESPWRSVGTALKALRAGDTLHLRGGTYVEDVSVDPADGSPSARITVKAFPGERPVIQGLFHLRDADYMTLDGVNVTWRDGLAYTSHMVKMTGGTGWVIQNSELWGARSFANLLIAGSPSNWAVRGNCIHDVLAQDPTDIYRYQNIYANTGLDAGPGLIENNLLFNATTGSNLKLGGPLSDSTDGSANVTVRYNTLYNARQPLAIAGGSHHNTLERNIVVRGVRESPNFLVRAYKLTGAANSLSHTWGSEASMFLYDSFPAGYGTFASVEGTRFGEDPRFNQVNDCNGFVPANTEAAAFGRQLGQRAALAVPTGLSAVDPGTGSAVSLDWADNSDSNLGGYNVYRSTDGATFARIALPTSSMFSDTGLTNGTAYTYRVTAVDTSGNESAPSAHVTGTPTDTTPPPAPLGLVATPGDRSVSLDWDDNRETDLAGYDLFRSTDNGFTYGQVNTSRLTSSAYSDTGLTNGTTYTYFVKAVEQSGNRSAASLTVSATPQSPAISLTTKVLGKIKGVTSVELVWGNATGSDVNVLRNGSKLVTTRNTGSYVDKVKGSGTFTYQVCQLGTAPRCSNRSTVTF